MESSQCDITNYIHRKQMRNYSIKVHDDDDVFSANTCTDKIVRFFHNYKHNNQFLSDSVNLTWKI